MADQIQIRRDTAANWTSVDPVLAQGELGVETDTEKMKIGDGTTAWSSLNYFITTQGSVAISGGTIDGTVIGGSTAAAGSFTTLTASDDVNFDSGTLFVDASANNVGIGTSSPLGKLAVEGNGTNSEVVLSRVAEVSGLYSRIGWTVANGLDIGVDNGNVLSASHITMSVDGSEGMRLTSTGLGIGNSSPTATLDVNGTIKLDGNYPVGTANVALGDAALNGSITGNYNTALGNFNMQPITSGASNTGVGNSALRFVTSGSNNTAVGDSSLFSNTTASNNTAVGYQAGYSGTTAANNSWVGYQAGKSATGNYNTGMGDRALTSMTSAEKNSAFGMAAAINLTTGSYNTAIGTSALESTTTASNNTAVGYLSLYANTTGASNTAVGEGAGSLITTGSANTIIGRFNGNQGGVDIRTANNNIVLSDGDGNPRVIVDASGNVGIGTSSPYNSSKLDVLGSIISTSQTIAAYAANNAGFDFAAGTKVGRFFTTSSDATGGHMTFITGAGGGSERMRLDSSGTLSLSHNLREAIYNLTGTDINPTNGGIQYKTLSANTTFTESLADGDSVILRISGGATYTVTWPTMTWVTSAGNAAPTLGGSDVLVLWQESSTVYGAYVGSYA